MVTLAKNKFYLLKYRLDYALNVRDC